MTYTKRPFTVNKRPATINARRSVVNARPGTVNPRPSGVVNFNLVAVGAGATVLQSVQSDLGITLNGSNVSAWADQSGNGKDYTQSTGSAQPVYGSTTVNGFSALTFNGTSHFMASSLNLGSPGTTNVTIWGVFRQLAWTSGGRVISATSGNFLEFRMAPSTPTLEMANGVAAVAPNSSATINTWVRFESLWTNSTSDYLKLGSNKVNAASTPGNAACTGRQIAATTGIAFSNIEVLAVMHMLAPPAAVLTALDQAVTTKYAGLVAV